MSFRTLTIAMLAASVLAMSLPSAEAGHRRHRHYNYHHDNGAAAAIIGLGFGMILGSALAAPRYDYRYYDRAPVQYRPRPWTAEWYRYCADTYRTFDPRTGKYRGYDGYLHFCR